nr:AMIN domain-containing protein [Deltaproteobacteria bacterium]
MRKSHPTVWIVTVMMVVALGGPVRAKGADEIRAVEVDDRGDTTRVRVKGARGLTFTVYKLERPSRVVLDVPRARLAEVLSGHEGATVLMPNTWAVSTIAAQQVDDGGHLVRVIVTLARPGRYDVKAEGNDIVVVVTARDAAPAPAAVAAGDPGAVAKLR